MPGTPLSSVEEAIARRPHFRRQDDLLAFTHELVSIVSLARWQRGECCDAVVANAGIGWVLSGIVRKCLILENGQRRIIDLIMPGDFLGPVASDARLCSFEASTDDTSTASIVRRDLHALAAIRPLLYRFFHERACQTITRLEDHIVVQGRTTSTQKIASYLLLMSRRLQEEQDGPVILPMSRYDIADHIGIAVETVSRAITELRRQGVIELETPRCVSIRDARKLADGISPDAA